ncbi:hypothetical protein K5X82_07375 [Halosquirtibacter xylanolyticus]|uniref:hypothetical protein n=1 Tax=Halosquirtibacter xylanolyticus TaxID=3374599 RepID=UPI0037490599|nr:hypothetical protein K5X82_07375 [Prolixibacteraceae bacterium]
MEKDTHKPKMYLLQLNINLQIDPQKIDYKSFSNDLVQDLKRFKKKISISEYPVNDSDPADLKRMVITVGELFRMTFSKIRVEIWTKPQNDLTLSFLSRIVEKFKIKRVEVVRISFIESEYILPKLKDKILSDKLNPNDFNDINLKFSQKDKEEDVDIVKTESINTKSITLNNKLTSGFILTNSHSTNSEIDLSTKKSYRNNLHAFSSLIERLIDNTIYSITNLYN